MISFEKLLKRAVLCCIIEMFIEANQKEATFKQNQNKAFIRMNTLMFRFNL